MMAAPTRAAASSGHESKSGADKASSLSSLLKGIKSTSKYPADIAWGVPKGIPKDSTSARDVWDPDYGLDEGTSLGEGE